MSKSDRDSLLIEAARRSGQSLDLLVALSDGLSDKAVARLCGNAESLPRYKKSKLSPYIS